MRNKEIDTMPTGRELDALIGEAIFGMRWLRSSATGARGLFPRDSAPQWFTEQVDMTEHLAVGWNYFVPCYSTKIAAAFEVVERLRELGKGQQFADCFINETPWHWVFLETKFFCGHICRAALKAVSADGIASAGLADQDRQI